MASPLWHNLALTELLKHFETAKDGLTSEQAKRKLKKFGPNLLPERKKVSSLTIFISQFRSPLAYVLIFASSASLLVGQLVDVFVILAALLINAIGGFIQEKKANQAIEDLKKIIDYKAIVIRDGQEKLISSIDLVPGDVILLQAGDHLTADARLLEAQNFSVSESVLTGESMPADKNVKILPPGTVLAEMKNMVYSGTTVLAGRAKAIICETGKNTELGKIAKLITETPEEETPLQKKLKVFSKFFGALVLLMSLSILLIGIITGKSFFEMFLIAIALAVSAIPEGLLISITVILALGMQRILKRNALVRRLAAAETLGSISVICTDKTGTLTEGKMQVAYFLTAGEEFEKIKNGGYRNKKFDHSQSIMRLLYISLICNNAAIENPNDELSQWRIIGSPTEQALITAATQMGVVKNEIDKNFIRLAEIPFDSEKKLMATLNKVKKGLFSINVKGAPEKLLELSTFYDQDGSAHKLTPEIRSKLNLKFENLTKKGLRVLAVAYKNLADDFVFDKDSVFDPTYLKDLVLVGFIGIKDPLRPEAKETIRQCRLAGIKPVIITGDHKLTAEAIAREIGFEAADHKVLLGKDLAQMSDESLKKQVKKVNIFARVSPSDKLRIVKAYKDNGEVVAMTGDGINDAPALKYADIGIALGTGVDVAKETSDIVLLDNNFKTIINAVKQGRIIFDNIRKVILYLLSDTFSEVIVVVFSLFLGLPLPLLAIQILWINLINDGLPGIALTFDEGEEDVMANPPVDPAKPILDKELKALIFVVSFFSGFGNLLIFYFFYKLTGDLDKARTVIFVTLGLDSLFYIFSCRALKRSVFNRNIFSNLYLVGSVIFSFLLFLVVVYSPFFQKVFQLRPLLVFDWVVIISFCLFIVLIVELTKSFFYQKRSV